MKLITRAGKQFRKAKLEHTIIQEASDYMYDENGDVVLNEEGEALITTEKKKTLVFTAFNYDIVDQTVLDKNQYIRNVWNQDCTFTIKTSDNIDPQITDRVVINDKPYSITNIYKHFDDSTVSMFDNGGFYMIYIGLKGAVSL